MGTGTSHSVNEMLQMVMDHLGTHRNPVYVETPMSNYVIHTRADTSKAKRELGFEAKHSLDEGLRLMLEEQANR